MKRIFSNPVFALAVGLCLRLLLVLKFPATSGDTAIYEEIATNWLKHHVYGMDVHGAIVAVDLRMPGYPAFLALLYALTGRSGESARLWVMLAQIGVDLLACWVIASIGGLLASAASGPMNPRRVFMAGLWLAVLCPFTSNYSAVPLTEVFAVFLTALASTFLLIQILKANQTSLALADHHPLAHRNSALLEVLGGLFVGLATLFRPESPLLLAVWGIVLVRSFYRQKQIKNCLRPVILSGLACVIPLVPWAIRNAITLHELQFLTPKYSTLPGELVPYGFMAWEKTWLYRMRDCYLVPWKLNEEAIDVEEIPARAFDSQEEKGRIAAILEQYNEDLTLTKEEDDAFGEIARERNAHHPLRTFLWIPAARVFTIWFTPRIELLPISGNVFPLAQMRDEDPEDQEFTILLFLVNIFYLGLGAWGAARLWHASTAVRPALAFLILFLLLRTAFLTTLETPEPRYVLVCFPALIAFGAQLFARKQDPSQGV